MMELKLNSDSVKEMFPDWAEIKPGDWSEHGVELTYGLGHSLYVGLYREPIDELGRIATDEEADIGIYDGRYTLQVFDGDDVIFCADVNDLCQTGVYMGTKILIRPSNHERSYKDFLYDRVRKLGVIYYWKMYCDDEGKITSERWQLYGKGNC